MYICMLEVGASLDCSIISVFIVVIVWQNMLPVEENKCMIRCVPALDPSLRAQSSPNRKSCKADNRIVFIKDWWKSYVNFIFAAYDIENNCMRLWADEIKSHAWGYGYMKKLP